MAIGVKSVALYGSFCTMSVVKKELSVIVMTLESPLRSYTYWNATAPEPPSRFCGVTGCGDSLRVSMIDCILRA